MSATASLAASAKEKQNDRPEVMPSSSTSSNYKGFVAGAFSGVTKLAVGHPFDTVKVRLQTSSVSQFKGPLDCVMQTLRKEGINGIYKGATPPLIGWACMDSVMLGSLTLYRRLLNEHIFQPLRRARNPTASSTALSSADASKLPTLGHAIAGTLAGWTVSYVAAPVEHVKARLQVQYAASKAGRAYAGPIDCTRQLIQQHGVRHGLYHGLGATLIFRSFFCVWWGSYDALTRLLQAHTALSAPAINFWAGGLSAQLFWLAAYPSDVVKQRIMTDELDPDQRRFPRWRDAATTIYRESGLKGYWRGFLPCFLRAFPANAMALVAFEGVMRALH